MTLIKRKNWVTPFDLLDEWEKGLTSKQDEGWLRNSFAPDLDLVEEESLYRVHVDIPGLKKEDLEISVSDNVLTIKGERKEETEKKKKDYYHFERKFGSFSRVVQLPAEVNSEGIKAAYKDGVLDVTIPKSERVKPKQINVDVK